MSINKKIILPLSVAVIALALFTSSTFFQGSLIFNSDLQNANEISSNIRVNDSTLLLSSSYESKYAITSKLGVQELYRFFVKAFKDDIRLAEIDFELLDDNQMLSDIYLYIGDTQVAKATKSSDNLMSFIFDEWNSPIVSKNEALDLSLKSFDLSGEKDSTIVFQLKDLKATAITSGKELESKEIQIENPTVQKEYLKTLPELKTSNFSLDYTNGHKQIYEFTISASDLVHIARLTLNVETHFEGDGQINNYEIYNQDGAKLASNQGTKGGGLFTFDFSEPLKISGSDKFMVYADISNLNLEKDYIGVQLMSDSRAFSEKDLSLFEARKEQVANFVWSNDTEAKSWKNGFLLSTLPTDPQLSANYR